MNHLCTLTCPTLRLKQNFCALKVFAAVCTVCVCVCVCVRERERDSACASSGKKCHLKEQVGE